MKESSTPKAAGRSPDKSFSLCLTKNSVDPIVGQPYPVDNLASDSVGSYLYTALRSGLQAMLFVDTNNTVTHDFNSIS
jgi:hypothetical protein